MEYKQFINRSEYRGYILGNIVEYGAIYKIRNFDKIVNTIRTNIFTENIIDSLNLMFTPIKGDDSYPDVCVEFEKLEFKKITCEYDIIYNNNFINKIDDVPVLITVSDVMLIHSLIEYDENISDKQDNSEKEMIRKELGDYANNLRHKQEH